jgi:hypothetical protein
LFVIIIISTTTQGTSRQMKISLLLKARSYLTLLDVV